MNMSFNDQNLTCVATNTHRLSMSRIDIKPTGNKFFNIPSTSLSELIKLIGSTSNEKNN
ncbi:hypothetical protein [Psychrobacillus glaciei]|uniref:hypothetical protein n=1 Tax=Psychrobacillus glaciei TaxID=2283160 RepID=UPI0021F4B39A|nr:hypothetical protein [Psychrobacillus glaciei]